MDTAKTATDATKGVPGVGGAGPVANTDPAKGDVQGNRKGSEDEKGNTVTPKEKKDSSLRINIELDIDIEIHLTARIKGDITIGLL